MYEADTSYKPNPSPEQPNLRRNRMIKPQRLSSLSIKEATSAVVVASVACLLCCQSLQLVPVLADCSLIYLS